MQKVALGLLGPVLDQGTSHKRWERWRPTVALCQQDDLLIRRFVLLYQRRYSRLLKKVVEDIRQVSPETEVIPRLMEFDNPWNFEEVFSALHDFAVAFPFDPEQEEYLVHITTGTHVAQICLFLLTESRHLPARLVQTSPSRQPETKTSGDYTIIDLDLSRYDRIATRFNQEKNDDICFLKSGIATRNHQFNRLIEQIEQVAANSVEPILLTGPTGAGKSRLARRIYELKKARHRLKGTFVEVNCATLRGDASMSALFGHKRGAFTGAIQDRPGLLRAADGGILFLDEVGELGADEQAMLLRAIEEKTFLPVGSDMESASDFQLLCGTNRDLNAAVAQGTFREDLLARINLWTFHLPGLRERPEDIEPNLDYELDRFAERTGTRVTFNREARRHFLTFAMSSVAAWSANFRDLGAAVTRMATLAPGGRITVEEVDEEIARLRRGWPQNNGNVKNDFLAGILGEEALADLDLFDQAQLTRVLEICRSSRSLSEAGRILYQASRREKKTTNDADRLRKYLAKFGITWKDIAGK
ncbi:sigma-54-dependent transcriptional regulator of RNA 3'-phosphate cyclase, RtcR domain-containing [Syntrophotalea carbinolica DSM 2380]|uniref:Sigma-54-dependent transcriptional regulator of RNA 3'-phosphate cyclase, RtcR domain-containing n=1 Tax=Syntrophotalea carbinolica (strain DSM 2380 / NBRC 103641 / GraBd1) TaxID=338963 RepID=Q3A0N4_SYNC1|nr:RNA repair transcriptional activator RtcR [Syntrophotalea carbinolica]ABA90073.1 sigma-54-dependent transcriptional regulator of RNA 3'-phosphate cyclase, RtcR domain-containing [Syntrophotalea carbinolica DSM 2380]